MAMFRWRGNGPGVKSAWDDGRNWVDSTGWAYPQSRYPSSTWVSYEDEVIFDSPLQPGAQSPAGFGVAVPLAKFAVMPQYSGAVGSENAPVSFDAREVTIQATRSTGVFIDASSGHDNLTILDGKVSGMLTAANLVILKGKVTLKEWTAVTDSVLIGYVASQMGDAQVVIEEAVGLPEDTRQYGGSVICRSEVPYLTMTGGAWTQTGGAIIDVTLYNGTCLWNGTGYCERVRIFGGLFDCSNSQNTRRIGTVHIHPAGSLDLNTGSETVVIVSYIDNQGGDVRFPIGSRIDRYLLDTGGVNGGRSYGLEPRSIAGGAVAVGDGFLVGPNDSTVIFCQVGSGGAGGSVAFSLWAAADDTFAGESLVRSIIIGPAQSFGQSSVESWQLPVGKSWLRVKATNQTSPSASVFASCIANVKKPQ